MSSLVACVLLSLLVCLAYTAPIYVSLSGNDAWSGLYPAPQGNDGPVRSLSVAQTKARSQASPKSVVVRGGTYSITSQLSLTNADSNTVWQAYAGETVILNGGVTVNSWNQALDSYTSSRLSAAARPHVYQADLKALGITTFNAPSTSGPGMELSFNNRPMVLARYPNIVATIDQQYNYTRTGAVSGSTSFSYLDSRVDNWSAVNSILVHGYLIYDWSDSIVAVSSIDKSTKKINLAQAPLYGLAVNRKFFYMNVLEELDAPGEYYINRTTGIVYFWPPAAITTGSVTVSVLSSNVFSINSINSLTIRGFVIQGIQNTGITATNSVGVSVTNCSIYGAGESGIVFNNVASSEVQSCNVHYAGVTGIFMSGGDRITLTRSNSILNNSDVSNFARYLYCYRPAVQIYGVGITVSHNHFHQAPHAAINVGPSNMMTYEYNEIDHVVIDSGDAGAFYIGRDWTSQGQILRYNYVHDVYGVGNLAGSGFYFDDENSGHQVYGNVFERVYRAILLGGGRDTSIVNNIFVNCTSSVYVDARGLTGSPNNSVSLQQRYAAMPTSSAVWASNYPHLVNLLQDNPFAPKYDIISNNINVNAPVSISSLPLQYVTPTTYNYAFTSSDFVNLNGNNLAFSSTSPARNLGFPAIPFCSIGLVGKSPFACASVTRCMGPVDEHQVFSISCPQTSQTIVSVQFASYGTPTGSCGSFATSTCHSITSRSVFEAKCLKQTSCSFIADNNAFGDPCSGTFKRFSAQVSCA